MAKFDVFLSHHLLPNGLVHPKVSYICTILTKRYGLTVCFEYEKNATNKPSCLLMNAMKDSILHSKVVVILLTDEYIAAVNAGNELNIYRMEFFEGLQKGLFVIPVALTSSLLDDHPWPGDVGEYLNDYVAIYIQGEREKESSGWGNLLALAMGDSNHHQKFEDSNGFEDLYIHLLAKLTNRQTLLFTDNLKANDEAGTIHLRTTSPTMDRIDDVDDMFMTTITTTTTTSTVLLSTILTQAFAVAAQALIIADDARALVPADSSPIPTDKPGMSTTLKTPKSKKTPRTEPAVATEVKTTATMPLTGSITTTHFLGDVLTGERDEHGRCHGLAKCVYGSSGGGGGNRGDGSRGDGDRRDGNRGDNSLVYEGEWQAGRYHGLGYKHWLWPVYQDPGKSRSSNSNSNSWVGVSSYAGQWRDGLKHGVGVCHYNNNNNNHINNITAAVDSDKNNDSGKDIGSEKDKNQDQDQKKVEGKEKESDQKKDKGYSNKDQNYARYAGSWSKDTFDGKGVLIWVSGDYYIGDFKQGVMHGTGIWYRHTSSSLSSSDCWYEGEFREGMYDGQGVLKKTYDDKRSNKDKGLDNNKNLRNERVADHSDVFGLNIPTSFIVMYEGAWLKGKRHGYGVEYWPPHNNSTDDSVGGMQQQVRYKTSHHFFLTTSFLLPIHNIIHHTLPTNPTPYT